MRSLGKRMSTSASGLRSRLSTRGENQESNVYMSAPSEQQAGSAEGPMGGDAIYSANVVAEVRIRAGGVK